MKNILVITLGTREIQLNINKLRENKFEIGENSKYVEKRGIKVDTYPNNNFEDYLCISWPRIGGKSIIDNFELFKDVIELPLIEKAIKQISKDNKLSSIFIVYTDQKDLDLEIKANSNNYDRDTLHFKEIIVKKIIEVTESVIEELTVKDFYKLEISEKVIDIDFQYKEFAKKCRTLFDDTQQIKQVFLLPQGGIDQINHSLTLQLIQAFKNKVIIWQQAEGTDAKQLEFANLFINDLEKQKIIKHLNDMDFDKAFVSFQTDTIYSKLCNYAALRLELENEKALGVINNLTKKEKSELDKSIYCDIQNWKNLKKPEQEKIKLIDLYHSINILIHQNKFNLALMRYFTFFENFFKNLVELNFQQKMDDFKIKSLKELRIPPENLIKNENQKYIKFINSLNPELLKYLKCNKVWFDNPSRKANYYIIKYFLYKKEIDPPIEMVDLENFNEIVEKLSGKRNDIAHNLASLNKKDFIGLLKGANTKLSEMNKMVEKILMIKSEVNIFNEIKSIILNSFQ